MTKGEGGCTHARSYCKVCNIARECCPQCKCCREHCKCGHNLWQNKYDKKEGKK